MKILVWIATAVCATAASVATRDTPLRSGCADDSAVRTTVPAGSPLTIRSMMSGEREPCYKVGVTVEGKSVEGYVDASVIGGAEEFDRARRQAESVDWSHGVSASPTPAAALRSESAGRQANSFTAGMDSLVGMRVELQYERQALTTDRAREMLGTLDQEYARITAELGCPTQDRVAAIAQSREAYLKATNAAEWSGGMFDGRIHMPVTSAPNENLHQALAHEMVHACLTMIGRWPTWFQEGVAQKLSGQTLSPSTKQSLSQAIKAGKVPRLAELGQGWMGLNADSARAAYAESLAAIDLFYEHHSGLGLRNLVRNPDRLPEITADLDRLLRE